MASIGEVAEALAGRLAAISGLTVTDYVPATIAAPAAFVSLGEITEDTFGYETMQVPFDVVVLFSRNSARVGSRSWYELASPADVNSVWTMIANDPTLGLVDTDARVVRCRPLGFEEVAAIGYQGGLFEVEVTTPGTI